MHNKHKWMIVIAILVATMVTIASCKIYFLRENSGGYVIWNADEAYLFIHVTRQGLPVRYLRYPLFVVGEILGVVESVDDDRASVIVIRVTSSSVERHVLKLADRADGGPGSDPGEYTPLEGHIYAMCPPLDGLCRWAGDHFERATQEERQRLYGIKSLTRKDFENDKDGWSRRQFRAGSTDRKFTIKVGDKFELSVNNIGVNGTENGTVSIDLLRPGKAPERIKDFYRRERKVSRTEYQHAFQDLN